VNVVTRRARGIDTLDVEGVAERRSFGVEDELLVAVDLLFPDDDALDLFDTFEHDLPEPLDELEQLAIARLVRAELNDGPRLPSVDAERIFDRFGDDRGDLGRVRVGRPPFEEGVVVQVDPHQHVCDVRRHVAEREDARRLNGPDDLVGLLAVRPVLVVEVDGHHRGVRRLPGVHQLDEPGSPCVTSISATPA